MDKELGTRIYVLVAPLLVVAAASGCATTPQTSGGIPKSYYEALEEQREKPRMQTASSFDAPQGPAAGATATVDTQTSGAIDTERSASVPAPAARSSSEEFLRASARGISAGTVEGLAAGFSAGGLGLAIVPVAVTAAIGLWKGMGSARLEQQSVIGE